MARALPLAAHDAKPLACEERDYKGLHAFPSNITRDDPPITRDYPPPLLRLQGRSLAELRRVSHVVHGEQVALRKRALHPAADRRATALASHAECTTCAW